jgi:hypothetical protein
MEVLFSRFGPVESIRVFPGKTFAFVNYHHANHAIAAKAALDGQPSPQVRGLTPPPTAPRPPPAHPPRRAAPALRASAGARPHAASNSTASTDTATATTATAAQITGLKPLVIRFQRDGVTARSYNDLRRLVAGKPLSRSSSQTNLVASGSSSNLHRLVEDEMPPEPAINLSNRLNPNNIHYDRELAARCAAGAGRRGLGAGAGCSAGSAPGRRLPRLHHHMPLAAHHSRLHSHTTHNSHHILHTTTPHTTHHTPHTTHHTPHTKPPPPPSHQTHPSTPPRRRYKRMTKAEKEALWAQDRALQQLANSPSTLAGALANPAAAALANRALAYGALNPQLAATLAARSALGLSTDGLMPRNFRCAAACLPARCLPACPERLQPTHAPCCSLPRPADGARLTCPRPRLPCSAGALNAYMAGANPAAAAAASQMFRVNSFHNPQSLLAAAAANSAAAGLLPNMQGLAGLSSLPGAAPGLDAAAAAQNAFGKFGLQDSAALSTLNALNVAQQQVAMQQLQGQLGGGGAGLLGAPGSVHGPIAGMMTPANSYSNLAGAVQQLQKNPSELNLQALQAALPGGGMGQLGSMSSVGSMGSMGNLSALGLGSAGQGGGVMGGPAGQSALLSAASSQQNLLYGGAGGQSLLGTSPGGMGMLGGAGQGGAGQAGGSTAAAIAAAVANAFSEAGSGGLTRGPSMQQLQQLQQQQQQGQLQQLQQQQQGQLQQLQQQQQGTMQQLLQQQHQQQQGLQQGLQQHQQHQLMQGGMSQLHQQHQQQQGGMLQQMQQQPQQQQMPRAASNQFLAQPQQLQMGGLGQQDPGFGPGPAAGPSASDLAAALRSKQLPPQYMCPLTRDVMVDPVVAADGFSYERQAISEWMRMQGDVSPMTGQPLPSRALQPNYGLRSAMLQELSRP